MCFRDLVLGLLCGRFVAILAPFWEPKTFVLFYGDLAVDKMRKAWILRPLQGFQRFFKGEKVNNVLIFCDFLF